MIQIIGLLVALYVITRMFHLFIDKSKEINIITALSAGITLLFALFAIYSLVKSGAEISSTLLR